MPSKRKSIYKIKNKSMKIFVSESYYIYFLSNFKSQYILLHLHNKIIAAITINDIFSTLFISVFPNCLLVQASVLKSNSKIKLQQSASQRNKYKIL